MKPTTHEMILSRKLSKMIDNSNNMQSRLGGGVGNITGLRERNINSGVTDRDVRISQILDFTYTQTQYG